MTFAADLIGALDALVASRVFLDEQVPPATAFPYITIIVQPYDSGPALKGDRRALAWTTPAQVDVWQLLSVEDESLPRQCRSALNGLALTAPRMHLRVASMVRVPEEPPSTIAHHAITVETVEVG